MLIRSVTLITTTLVLMTGLLGSVLAGAQEHEAFQRTWDRTDRPVRDGVAARTWMWGPQDEWLTTVEPYAEAPGSEREVMYFDKARMEITNPNGDQNSIWYVTNGLLVVELITGRLQIGDNSFAQRSAATVNVAGDADDPDGPTYATFSTLLDAAPGNIGATLTQRLDRAGNVSDDPALAGHGVTRGQLDDVTNHAIAAPFWNFMNSSGPVYDDGQYVVEPLFENAYFATGRPITEPYWAEVKVGGQQRDVLMQCFERRCLTYTPGNPAGFVVEAGNVGQHYYNWRYDDETEGEPTPTPSPTATATATTTSTAPPSPSSTPTATPTEEPPMYETPETDIPETAYEYAFSSAFGRPSLNVELDSPHKVALAPTGEIFVTNTGQNQVLKFDADGLLLSKWGSKGSGNGQFSTPVGVAVDSDGFVYIADFGNNRIQKFQSDGAFVETWSGLGAAQGSLDGPWDLAISNGDTLYVTELNNNRIQSFNTDGDPLKVFGKFGSGDGEFIAPHGIDVDADGRIYVADTGNSRLQVISTSGIFLGKHGTFGSGAGQFKIPTDIDAGPDGKLFVTELGNDRVQRFSPAAFDYTGELSGGFNNPMGLTIAADGRLYVADMDNKRIQIFASPDPDANTFPELFDSWTTASRERFSTNAPTAMAMGPDGLLYIVDRGEQEIKVMTPSGDQLRRIDFQVTDTLLLDEPLAIAIDDSGNLYIPDNVHQIVVKLDASGRYIAQFGESGDGNGQFANPKAVAVDAFGNVYVGDDNGVQKFGPDFSFIAASRVYGKATAIALRGDRVYVTNPGSHDHVSVYDLDLNPIWAWGINFDDPSGIAFDEDGFAYVSDSTGLIQKFFVTDNSVEQIAQIGRPGSADGEIAASPYPGPEILVDADGLVYVSDPGNQRVLVFAPAD